MTGKQLLSGLGVLSLVLAACAGANDSIPPTPESSADSTAPTSTSTTSPASMSPEAAAYLDEAVRVMREHSINRDVVDWEALEEAVLRRATGARTVEATHPAIGLGLRLLDDDHSVFLAPEDAAAFTDEEPVFTAPEVEVADGDLGYVAIYRFLGDIGTAADAYASELARRIAAIDVDVCGWIVDLRSNTGGNMWPMIAGLAPLLGPGVVGSFTYPDGGTESWEIADGATLWDGMPMTAQGRFEAIEASEPVAVLIGPNTASSGEAVAVAFHGREGTTLIGEPTRGLTTANEPVELPDGAMLILTMSSFTDRHGQAYGQDIPVEPDIPVAVATAEAHAVEWLRAQPGCP